MTSGIERSNNSQWAGTSSTSGAACQNVKQTQDNEKKMVYLLSRPTFSQGLITEGPVCRDATQ